MGKRELNSVLKNSDTLILEHQPDAPSLVSFRDAGRLAEGDKTFSFTSLSRLLEAFERAYGPQAGRGMSLQVGRACVPIWTAGIRRHSRPHNDCISPSSASAETQHGRPRPCGPVQQSYRPAGAARATQTELALAHRALPALLGAPGERADLPLAVGLVQEWLYWLSGGKIFNVEEIACIARGDPACTLVIDRDAHLT